MISIDEPILPVSRKHHLYRARFSKRALRASHPPAGATVLIVSLGLLKTPTELAMIVAGVAILTVAGWVINRALGTPMPLWSSQG